MAWTRTSLSCKGRGSGWLWLRRGIAHLACHRLNLRVSEAVHAVVVDHPHRLHEGIADGRADEAELATQEVLAHRLGFRRARRDRPQRPPPVDPRTTPHELPEIGVQAAELLLDGQGRPGVGDGRLDLEPVAGDAGDRKRAL